ncbi:MAG: hypothetical protein M3Y53_08990 [Thermoproteota archaeon]|nr:hypothetical protein [Thermoproteota archaeon]
MNISYFEFIENFSYIDSACCEASQIYNIEPSLGKMNHKNTSLAIVAIVEPSGLNRSSIRCPTTSTSIQTPQQSQ